MDLCTIFSDVSQTSVTDGHDNTSGHNDLVCWHQRIIFQPKCKRANEHKERGGGGLSIHVVDLQLKSGTME
jgi:hypothetical protein